jgi:hypothetical protein
MGEDLGRDVKDLISCASVTALLFLYYLGLYEQNFQGKVQILGLMLFNLYHPPPPNYIV